MVVNSKAASIETALPKVYPIIQPYWYWSRTADVNCVSCTRCRNVSGTKEKQKKMCVEQQKEEDT